MRITASSVPMPIYMVFRLSKSPRRREPPNSHRSPPRTGSVGEPKQIAAPRACGAPRPRRSFRQQLSAISTERPVSRPRPPSTIECPFPVPRPLVSKQSCCGFESFGSGNSSRDGGTGSGRVLGQRRQSCER
jgi:hypothetical protein